MTRNSLKPSLGLECKDLRITRDLSHLWKNPFLKTAPKHFSHLHCVSSFPVYYQLYSTRLPPFINIPRFTDQSNFTCSRVSILQSGTDSGFSLYSKRGQDVLSFNYRQHRIDIHIERNLYISLVYIIYKQYT